MNKSKKYKIICIICTITLIIGIIIEICMPIVKRAQLRKSIFSKLTEEELKNVNMKELIDDIGEIKHAKQVEKKGGSVIEIIEYIRQPYYEGDGYTIRACLGGECMSYGYFCGEKEVYRRVVEFPDGTSIEEFVRILKANIHNIFFVFIAIIDIIFFVLYKKEKSKQQSN